MQKPSYHPSQHWLKKYLVSDKFPTWRSKKPYIDETQEYSCFKRYSEIPYSLTANARNKKIPSQFEEVYTSTQ